MITSHRLNPWLNWSGYYDNTGLLLTPEEGIPIKAYAICEDGIRRTIRLNMPPEKSYCQSGRTTIKKRSVTGFIDIIDNVVYFVEYY